MNEFNYEGWIGSIVGVYPSVSDFPSVGSEGCLYLVIDNGSGKIYAWDEEHQQYVTAGGGSISGAIIYKGAVAASTDLPSSPEVGWLYIASADFTLSSENVEAGDFLIWDGNSWNIIQGNVTGAVSGPSSASDGHLAVFDGTTGKILKDGGAVPVAATSIAASEAGYATGDQVYQYVAAQVGDIETILATI